MGWIGNTTRIGNTTALFSRDRALLLWNANAEPLTGAEMLAACLAFHPALLACTIDDARVQAQPGGFYGGWITPELVGPFKGEPGSAGW